MEFKKIEHPISQDLKAYEVLVNGEKVGEVRQYNGYIEKKAPGRRYVTSRKDAILWAFHPASPTERSSFGHRSRQAAVPYYFKKS